MSKNERMYEIKKMGWKRRTKSNDHDGESGGGGNICQAGTTAFLHPARQPLLYWFLVLSTFLPYRQGVSPSFGRPQLAGRYL